MGIERSGEGDGIFGVASEIGGGTLEVITNKSEWRECTLVSSDVPLRTPATFDIVADVLVWILLNEVVFLVESTVLRTSG